MPPQNTPILIDYASPQNTGRSWRRRRLERRAFVFLSIAEVGLIAVVLVVLAARAGANGRPPGAWMFLVAGSVAMTSGIFALMSLIVWLVSRSA